MQRQWTIEARADFADVEKNAAITEAVQALLRRDYKNIINNPVMQAWVHKNASLISIIEALAH